MAIQKHNPLYYSLCDSKLKGKDIKKISPNTNLISKLNPTSNNTKKHYLVTLHNTEIMELFHDRTRIFNHSSSYTTHKRLNEYLPAGRVHKISGETYYTIDSIFVYIGKQLDLVHDEGNGLRFENLTCPICKYDNIDYQNVEALLVHFDKHMEDANEPAKMKTIVKFNNLYNKILEYYKR